eukprot:732339-Pyramimonas_sp.AAC.2
MFDVSHQESTAYDTAQAAQADEAKATVEQLQQKVMQQQQQLEVEARNRLVSSKTIMRGPPLHPLSPPASNPSGWRGMPA